MATPSTVQRATEVGDQFRTFTTGGIHAQGASLVDEAGAHQGITGNGLVVAVEGTVQTTSAAETLTRFKTTGFQDEAEDVGTGACELRQLRVIPDATVTSTRYLMIFDSLTAPADTATNWVWLMVIPSEGEASETFTKGEMAFSTGCSMALSSTQNALTRTTANEALIFGVTEG